MNVLSPVMIVLAHPRAASFDHELTGVVRTLLGQTGVRQAVHDLYAESFDPVLTDQEGIAGEVWTRGTSSDQVRAAGPARDPLVDRHRRELGESRALVILHPDWWGKPPAILTGWLDRVLLAQSSAGSAEPPAPNLERVLVINTSDQEPDIGGTDTDPLGLLWREQIGPFLGSPDLERLTFRPIAGANDDQRKRWIAATQRAAAWVCGAAR